MVSFGNASESLFTLNHSASGAISSFTTSLFNSLILQPKEYIVVPSASHSYRL